MKSQILKFFHKISKKENDQSQSIHQDKINELSLNLKPIAKLRDIPIYDHEEKFTTFETKKRKNNLQRSKSLHDIRNAINSIKRDPAKKKLNRKPTFLQFRPKPLLSFSNKEEEKNGKIILNQLKLENFISNINYDCECEDFTNETSIFDYANNEDLPYFLHCNNFKPLKETYTNIYNQLYSECYNDNESISTKSSIISNKENVPPSEYLLSSSKTPNFSINLSTPNLNCCSTFETKLDEKHDPNPFLDCQLQLDECKFPHKNFMQNIKNNKQSDKHYRDLNNNKPDFGNSPLFLIDDKKRLFSPKTTKPLHDLPNIPSITPSSIKSSKLLNVYNNLLTEKKSADFDFEEKSLFDALSNVEWWDCSKVTMVSYNNLD
jgi:hypothetical protein